MIQLALPTALAFYSAILGIIVVTIWLYTAISVRRSYRVLEKQFLWRCVFCGYIYLDEEAEKLSLCPRCESYNSVEDKLARYVRIPVHEGPEQVPATSPQDPRRDTSHRKRPHQRHRGPRRR